MIEDREELTWNPQEVQKFAQAYQGRNWAITSIYAYGYKDTGEWCWFVHMRRKNHMQSLGERDIKLAITQKDGKFCARPVELRRLNHSQLLVDPHLHLEFKI
jgi:hypothetical protein